MKAIIMAGGQGTRFWPLSREHYPKQLLKLGDGHTLLQETVLRLDPSITPEDIFVITNNRLKDDIKSQLLEVGAVMAAGNILVEPMPRNTAAAVGLSALYLRKADEDCVMAVLPSDHAIKDKAKFNSALMKAEELARDGWLVVFGIKPDRPETGYGYIKRGGPIGDRGFEVDRFVEKPDRATADGYLRSGGYLWNSGMFVWKAETILDEIKLRMPELHNSLVRIWSVLGTPDEQKRLEEEFRKLKPVSIDYGVMELAEKVAVLPVDFGWSDLGSWDSVGQVFPPDSDGNITLGRVVSMGCKGTTIYAEDRLVATIGLEDTVVVDTPDATLVCRKDMAQDVKDVVGVLKEKGYAEYITHKTVHRPWGSYTVLQDGPMYKIKQIEVKPGARLSLQMHYHRSEHWIVVSGTALVTNGDRVYNVHVNESTYIPMSTRHRLENHGKVPLKIIEVQNGEYLEEDDIVRFDDEYGRAQHENQKDLLLQGV